MIRMLVQARSRMVSVSESSSQASWRLTWNGVPYENEDNRYNPDLPPVPRGVEIEREIPPNIFEDGTHQDLVLHPWDLISHSTTNSGSDLDPDWWSIVGEKDYDTTYFWEPPNLGNTEAADGNAPPVYHWQIWDDLIKAVNNNGTDQYSM